MLDPVARKKYRETLARTGYEAYGKHPDRERFVPPWNTLTPTIQEAWCVAAEAIDAKAHKFEMDGEF